MDILQAPEEMTAWSKHQAKAGRTIGLVPTMGCFHDGHLSLMRMASSHADRVVVSLFVNPTQFGPDEDLSTYPGDLERDSELARRQGVDILFRPEPEAMYPAGFQTSVNVHELTRDLCGADRPGHFTGVATVVTKLFNIVWPDCAVFGEKDLQQLAVIRQMVRDLNMEVDIVGHPIVREDDGLAMSSRNNYLNARQRPSALSLFSGIRLAGTLAGHGILDASVLEDEVFGCIQSYPGTEIDYVRFVDRNTLARVQTVDENTILAVAVKIDGKVRLIDNGSLMLKR